MTEVNRDTLGRCKMRGCNLCDGYRKEVEQYRALGTVEELKEAMEKQKPKKPIAKETKYTTISLCPICESTEIDDYCEKCGQAIDWGEEDEND